MKTFRSFVKSLPKAEQEAISHGTAEKVTALRLQQAREEAGVTQASLAERIGVTQANLSRMEHRADVKLSTLTHYIEALGGRLQVRAIIKGKVVELVG